MRFDEKHKSLDLTKSIYLKLIKLKHFEYHVLQTLFLFFKKINSFRIIQKMSNLIYKLKLLKIMRIHNVISIVHLKQAISNFYNRVISFSSLLIMKKKEFLHNKKNNSKKN